MQLRPYQQEGIEKIFSEWRADCRSVLFQMPTGTGKTVLFAEIVNKGYRKDRHIIVVAHRQELIEQIVGKLEGIGVEAGIIMAGEKEDYSKKVQVASIQTLVRRRYPAPDSVNLVIIDEAHHAKAATYRKLWSTFSSAKFLGVTATPIRLNGSGFDDMFDALVVSPPVRDFVQNNYLVKLKHFICFNPELKGVKVRGGDYVASMLHRVVLEEGMMANLTEAYRKYVGDRPMIVFAVDVEHSKSIIEQYLEQGIAAAHIDGNTPRTERIDTVNRFRNGEIKVVSNVNIITEGFDFPECEAVQIARPTKSLTLYLQMAGRVMRRAANKRFGLLLDHAGLWMEHGPADADREWSLEGVPKKAAVEREFVGFDDLGRVRKADRRRPQESKGLRLMEMTPELERLLHLELFIDDAARRNYKVVSIYFRYQEFLEKTGAQFTPNEFLYVKRRLESLNQIAPPEKRLNSDFWTFRQRELFPFGIGGGS